MAAGKKLKLSVSIANHTRNII